MLVYSKVMLQQSLVWWVRFNRARLLVGLAILVLLVLSAGIVFIPINNAPLKGRKVLWKHNLGEYISQVLPNSDWSMVYVLTRSNLLYGFDQAGKQLWQAQVPLGKAVSPSITLSSAEDVLVVGGRVKAFRYSKEGEMLWEFNSVLTPWFDSHVTPPGEAAEFVIWDDEYLIGLSINGDVTWATDEYEVQIFGRSLAKGESGNFNFPSDGNYVVALAANGSKRWRHQLRLGNTGVNGIQETGGLVLISDFEFNKKCGLTNDSYLYCLSESGNLLWEVNEGVFSFSPPSLFGDKVIIVGDWETAICYSTQGKLLWECILPGNVSNFAASSDYSKIMLLSGGEGSSSILGNFLKTKDVSIPDFLDGLLPNFWATHLTVVYEQGEIEAQYKLPNGMYVDNSGGPEGLVFEIHGSGKTLALAQWDILK